MAAKVDESAEVEGPWPLPAGWKWTALGALGTWMGGGTPSKANAAFWTNGTVPWVSPKDMKVAVIGETEDKVTSAAVEGSSAKYVPEGSVLMVMRSGILKHSFPVAITDRIVTLNQDLRALTSHDGISPNYIARYLALAENRVLNDCSKDGTTVNSVEVSALERVPVPLAPVAEQRRIVARVDALFAEVAEGEAALAEARKGLSTFRRALLKAAITGELTKDWRAANPVTETGRELLARIARDRASKSIPAARSRRAVDARLLDTSILPQLPPGWAWATVNEVKAGDQRNGISISGSPSPPGVKAMRLDALTARGLNLDAVRYIPLPEDRIQNYRVNNGDLLISRANGSPEFVGRAVYVADIGETVVFPDTMIRYPLGADQQIGLWIELAWNSPIGRSQIRRLAKTTAGILKISQEDIAQIALPIPPPAEAAEILRRVSDALTAAADTLAMLDAEAADAARLKQSILKAAFEGRLVSQDPTDEPAGALLARFAASPAVAPARRGRVRKSEV
ncbi:restriction endonuclease subunit S [Bradyrhizobium erythrophlei]|uniref:restriction endonuclease subunit S n=1 Tax=Bradyrhizobium erythrophlei TaxID=1437360 RepID=UPI001560BAAD|nr:restriction endonuclease subunit S [Bradyrhizobium erythrophlei]